MSNSKKILFISRAYPPILGGIENQNFGIAQALSKITPTRIIANKKGKKNLPFFLPYALFVGLASLLKFDTVVFGDGVLAPLGVVFKFLFPKKKYVSIIHGLDITFAYKKSLLGKIYRTFNIPSLKKLDKLIMVGNETINQAIKIGVPRDKCVFIPNGLELEKLKKDTQGPGMEKILGIDLAGKKVIFRAGRFVKHKGVEWFIRNVMPHLDENYIFVAAGGGVKSITVGDENNYPSCEEAIKELDLGNRVKLILNIPQPDMNVLFNSCDLYVSPNIKVPGSMEGFGINAIEGAVCGRMVLASDLEGLKDAIVDGQNGFLLEPENAKIWIEKIKEMMADDEMRKTFGEKARQFTIDNFTWDKISRRYLEEINKTLNKN